MTREEATKIIKECKEKGFKHTFYTLNEYYTALDMAIKALEQEPCDVFDEYGNYKYPGDVELTEPNTATSMPCEDAISRQAVLDIVDSYSESQSNVEDVTQDIISDIVALPPVNLQEPKTGRWIRQDNTKEPLYGWYFCSECNSVIGDKTKFCSNCGAKMEGSDADNQT